MTDTKGYGLRPAAQPYEFKNFSRSQKDAFASIVQLMKGAVVKLNAYQDDRNRKISPNTFGVMDDNCNRMSFLSGGRGSGKTSLIYSLIKAFGSPGTLSEKNRVEGNDGVKHLKENIGEIAKRIIWLRPIEMETLPTPDYMIASILARVEEAMDRFDKARNRKTVDKAHYSHLYHSHQSPNPVMDFEKFRQDVVKAWHGNLEQHSATMDSDTYIMDVVETERCRLKMNEGLINVLDELNDDYFFESEKEPLLFVLPLDDFDLNPRISVHLIKLIRLISVPQLFTIVAGDFRVAQDVFNLYAKGQLLHINERCTESGQGGVGPVIPIINRMAHENSSNAMRKLFPKSHIIELEPMTWEEVWAFYPHTHQRALESGGGVTPAPITNMTIGNILEKIRIDINTIPVGSDGRRDRFVAGHKIESIYDVFNIEVRNLVFYGVTGLDDNVEAPVDLKPGSKTREEMVYTAPVLYKMNHRHAYDLWRFLMDYVCEETDETKIDQERYEKIYINITPSDNDDFEIFWKKNQRFLVEFSRKFAKELFVQSSNDGECLSKELCDELMRTAQEDCYGKIQLVTDNYRIENASGSRIHFFNEATPGQVVICQPKDWTVKVKMEKSPFNPDPPTIKLSKRTGVSLMFLHDHLILADPSGIVGKSLMKKLVPPDWAYCLWPCVDEKGIKIAWPLPLMRSLWVHDIFGRCWAEVWKWVEKEENRKKIDTTLKDSKGQFELYLKYLWIRIGCRIFSFKENRVNSALFLFRCLKMKSELSKSFNPRVEEHIGLLSQGFEKYVEKRGMSGEVALPEACDDFIKLAGNEEAKNKVMSGLNGYIEKNVLVYLPSCEEPRLRELVKGENAISEIIEELCSLVQGDDDASLCETIHGRRETLIRSWLVRVICLLAPESGCEGAYWEAFMQQANETEALKRLFVCHDIVSEVRKLRAQSAARFFDKGLLKEVKTLFAPVARNAQWAPSAGENSKLSVELFSPSYEDIFALSLLTRREKERTIDALRAYPETLRMGSGARVRPKTNIRNKCRPAFRRRYPTY